MNTDGFNRKARKQRRGSQSLGPHLFERLCGLLTYERVGRLQGPLNGGERGSGLQVHVSESLDCRNGCIGVLVIKAIDRGRNCLQQVCSASERVPELQLGPELVSSVVTCVRLTVGKQPEQGRDGFVADYSQTISEISKRSKVSSVRFWAQRGVWVYLQHHCFELGDSFRRSRAENHKDAGRWDPRFCAFLQLRAEIFQEDRDEFRGHFSDCTARLLLFQLGLGPASVSCISVPGPPLRERPTLIAGLRVAVRTGGEYRHAGDLDEEVSSLSHGAMMSRAEDQSTPNMTDIVMEEL